MPRVTAVVTKMRLVRMNMSFVHHASLQTV